MHPTTKILVAISAAALLYSGCESRVESSHNSGSAPSAETGLQSAKRASPDDADAANPDGPWLRITQPEPGARVTNPVTFRFESSGVKRALLEVDGTPVTLDEFDPSRRQQVTDTSDPDSPHTAALIGYDESGETLARTSVEFYIDPDRDAELVGSFWNSYYYLPSEEHLYGGETAEIRGMDCHLIATVPMAFVRETCLQGSGRLDPEGVVTLAGRCDCGVRCPGGSKRCFTALDPDTYPWGSGPDLDPTMPLRTWAVDPDVLPQGSVVFAEEWDGLWIPRIGELGGFNHDGCFVAQDVGGSIHGNQVDIFVGTHRMWRALEEIYPTRSEITVYLNAPQCDSSPAQRLADR